MNLQHMSEVETVYLDGLNGFEFEQLCERIFHRAGWGSVERIGGVGDGGRDLIIHKRNGEEIVVECKHQPDSAIGRPIVQKLHSAVVSTGADAGIIITTGRYSQKAIEHAKILSEDTPIDLFDLLRLTELAWKAQIKLVIGLSLIHI